MSFTEDQIELVRQQVRAAQLRDRAAGTCVTRSTTGSFADVIFDGSTVSQPVKVLGNVFIQAGDRCVLDRYGSDWLVTGSFSESGFGESSRVVQMSSTTGTLTNSSYSDVTEFGTMPFSKFFDNTYVRFGLHASAYCITAAATQVQFGIRVTPVDSGSSYAATDLDMNRFHFAAINTHVGDYMPVRIVGIPAGSYTLSLRWKRFAGAGGVVADSGDKFVMEADERIRAASPIL